ncbi:hypothetical protein BC940DRAFT_322437 [Gongronella butleri]|nr:hypothetical protein BC940DRAFT_322437 [Gongronella butleri]
MAIFILPYFTLVFVCFFIAHSAIAQPNGPILQESKPIAELVPDLLGFASQGCTEKQLQSGAAYLGTDLLDALEACAGAGLPGRASCPPGGINFVMNVNDMTLIAPCLIAILYVQQGVQLLDLVHLMQ